MEEEGKKQKCIDRERTKRKTQTKRKENKDARTTDRKGNEKKNITGTAGADGTKRKKEHR
jgi:hypothetical protein